MQTFHQKPWKPEDSGTIILKCKEKSLEEEMATHSSVLAWRIPWTEEPGGLQSIGLQELDMSEWLNYPLRYPGLENSTDCTTHGAAKSWTRLSHLHFLLETYAQLSFQRDGRKRPSQSRLSSSLWPWKLNEQLSKLAGGSSLHNSFTPFFFFL